MNVHISYKTAKAPDVEREFQRHIEKLQKRLQVFRPELIHLHGIVEKGSARGDISVALNLRLPSGQMATQRAEATAVAAVKESFADLFKQLSRHKDLLRGGRHHRGRHGNGEAESPAESEDAPIAGSAEIHAYVNAGLGRLERYIERELRYRVTNGQLEPDQVTAEEVVDEVVASALSKGEHRPENLTLERWLYRLAILSIRALGAGSSEPPAAVHLEDSARRRNVLASDEPELQFHQPDEMLLTESVIADTRIETPEEIASSDELVARVEKALLSAPLEDREAFILFAVENFTLEEVAAITARSDEQVRASLHAAREHLKQTLGATERLPHRVFPQPRIA